MKYQPDFQSPESFAWLCHQDGSVVVGQGPFEAYADFPEHTDVAFYLQSYSLSGYQPWLVPNSYQTFPNLQSFHQYYWCDEPLSIQWEPTHSESFLNIFQEIKAEIAGEKIQKSVPVYTEFGEAESNPAKRIRHLLSRQPLPLMSYGFFDENQGFAGASPELLFTLKKQQLFTMALAGTAKIEDSSAFNLDEKEIQEHEYVTQFIISKLQTIGKVQRTPREILQLKSIIHFMTRMQVELSAPYSPDQLISLLHPTPALGPHPCNANNLRQLIHWRSLMQVPEQFGAPFGAWANGSFQAIVSIRGIWWQDQRLALPAGCGIIEASQLVNEWRELRLKREAVKHFLISTDYNDNLS